MSGTKWSIYIYIYIYIYLHEDARVYCVSLCHIPAWHIHISLVPICFTSECACQLAFVQMTQSQCLACLMYVLSHIPLLWPWWLYTWLKPHALLCSYSMRCLTQALHGDNEVFFPHVVLKNHREGQQPCCSSCRRIPNNDLGCVRKPGRPGCAYAQVEDDCLPENFNGMIKAPAPHTTE